MILDANPSLLGDGLVYDSNDWLTIAQQGNKGAKHRFACAHIASTNDIVAPDKICAMCHDIGSVTSPPPGSNCCACAHVYRC